MAKKFDPRKLPKQPLDRLLAVMAALRHPQSGCPWDLEQSFESIAPHTLEEAYEVIETIEQNNTNALKEELGDLLFQIVFFTQLGKEKKLFTFHDVALGVANKMIERHPHVFGLRTVKTAKSVLNNWEEDKLKKREREAKAINKPHSILDGITTTLPAMTRAIKLQKRAAKVGFDWKKQSDVVAKIKEELREVMAELTPKRPSHNLPDEIGDLLFAVVNLARKCDIDPETALRKTNRKFEKRFRYIESELKKKDRPIENERLSELERLWNKAKKLK